jgi:uncharacterized protein
MKKPQFLNKVVLQPTTLCNLNCKYCYLKGRHLRKNMSPEVTKRLANDIKQLGEHITLIWHGGEPLACGIHHFEELIAPFEDLESVGMVRQSLQTNATLITKEWCEFFNLHHFYLGVSIDGTEEFNGQRVDWSDKPAFDRIMKGIKLLKEHSIPFGTIAVVTQDTLSQAEALYKFFVSLGCNRLGVNIVEKEGLNTDILVSDNKAVQNFWTELFKAWQNNPVIKIREFDHLMSWMAAVVENQTEESPVVYFDPFPTIGWNGEVVLLSPEFLGMDSESYSNFVVGNILDQDLVSIVKKGLSANYVQEFSLGVQQCKLTCPYYSFCRGGQASNKYFEHGSTNATETMYCRNSEISLVDAVLELI